MPQSPAPFTRPALTKCAEIGVRDGSSQRLNFAPTGANATRRFKVLWNERYKFVRRFLGDNQIIYDDIQQSNMVRINRMTPLPWPTEDFPNLYAAEAVSITGFKIDGHTSYTDDGDDGSVAADYSHAEIELAYRPSPYDVLTDTQVDQGGGVYNELLRYISVSDYRSSTNYISLPQGTLLYIAEGGGRPTGIPMQFSVGKVIAVMEFVVTWHSLPYEIFDITSTNQYPWARRVFGAATAVSSETRSWPAVSAYLGCVNRTSFLSRDPGTVLLTDVRPEWRFNSYGNKEWDIHFTFAYDPNRWNYKWFAGVGEDTALSGYYSTGTSTTYYAPGSLPANYSIYSEKNFQDLFTVVSTPA